MVTIQGKEFWWDFQLGSFCSTTAIGSLGQYITPAEIASASGITLTSEESSVLQALFDNRNPDDLYTKAAMLTRTQFINKFTPAETKLIISIAKNNSDVELYLWKLQQAQDVSLLDPNTITGVQTLEAAGLIAVGRAAQILRVT
jgi:hypothetical protein